MPALPEAAGAAPAAGAGTVATAGCGAFLQALWGQAALAVPQPATPGLVALPVRAVLTGRGTAHCALHLPPPPAGGGHEAERADGALAMAAHAAAHLRFGGAPWPRAGLKPVQQALLGVLEDARVEWLALQELPGLRGLWRPFHLGADGVQGGAHCEALLARLALALLDPGHADPHPWVARARALFFAPDGRTLALHGLAELRQAASLLGNDLGQMRLPFNAPTYRVHARYRDDNSHLWLEQPDSPPSDTPLAAAAGGADAAPPDAVSPQPAGRAAPTEDEAVDAGVSTHGQPVAYAEWDHRIGRYRPGWCQVFELEPGVEAAPAGTGPEPRPAPSGVPALARSLARLRGPVPRPAGRAAWGEAFDTAALVEARVQQRLRQVPDARVYQRLHRPPVPLAVVVLLDASASTAAAAHGPGDGSLLAQLCSVARGVVAALEAAGHQSSLLAFASQGRARVELQRIKAWGEAAGAPAVAARLQGLRGAGSTRLGTVLRHAAALAATAPAGQGARRQVLLLTDGEAHDIDVHDPAYLAADWRRAAGEAARAGVATACLLVEGATAPATTRRAALRALRPVACAELRRPGELPRLLPALLGG